MRMVNQTPQQALLEESQSHEHGKQIGQGSKEIQGNAIHQISTQYHNVLLYLHMMFRST